MGQSSEEGKIGVWGRHQQETQHTTPSTPPTTSARVPSREAGGDHFQDKHGKEAQSATPREQEQSGKYN